MVLCGHCDERRTLCEAICLWTIGGVAGGKIRADWLRLGWVGKGGWCQENVVWITEMKQARCK